MDLKQAGSSLDSLISSFNTRIVELQELVIGRNMYAATIIPDLSAVDTAVKAMEFQMQSIKDRLREETEAIPKAKKLIDLSLRQQKKLEHMLAHVPSRLPESLIVPNKNPSLMQETSNHSVAFGGLKLDEEPAPPPKLLVNLSLGCNGDTKLARLDYLEELNDDNEDALGRQQHSALESLNKEKKGRGSAPLWYITADEFGSLTDYMRGRLTLDKLNAAINDIAAYAERNAQLISAPKKKLAENTWEKALELRDIAMTEAVKGKHFFVETDIKGPALKPDNTGKAILVVLRHLGRINETRSGHHRVFILSKPQ